MLKEKECGRKVKEGWGKRSLKLFYTRLICSYKLGQVSFIFHYEGYVGLSMLN